MRVQHLSQIPKLPLSVQTREGFIFDPNIDSWDLESRTWLSRTWNFLSFQPAGMRFVNCLKLGLISYLINYSFSYSDNLYATIRAFFLLIFREKPLRAGLIDLQHLMRYRALLTPNTIWKLGTLRILLLHLHEANLGVCTDKAIDYLRQTRIPGNPKGVDVRTRDPNRGAFSTSELEALQSSLTKAYADSLINISDFALTILFMAFGSRPVQVAALKESDLVVAVDKTGQKSYLLHIPRAKQRGQKSRSSFKARPCAQNVGCLLENLIDENAKARQSQGMCIKNPPLFLSKNKGEIPGFEWHETNSEISFRVRCILKTICPEIKAGPKRFRHTLGQRLADAGVSKYVIAELLDHSDTQNVGVYFEATTESATRISRSLALDLMPLAQAFKGTRVVPQQEADLKSTEGGRIYDRSLSQSSEVALGGCGQTGSCGLTVPTACYTCRHFQPFLEGPHNEELDKLISKRERQRLAGYDRKIFEILDRTIMAITQVIYDCELTRSNKIQREDQ